MRASPSGRVSRAQIVAMGRQGSPWEYVGVALAALRVAGQDHEVRFLLAAAYGRLGLRTAALEQIERFPAEVRADGNVIALREAMERLGPDRVGAEELARTAWKGVEAIRGRAIGAVDLGASFEEWRAGASGREYFRTTLGDLVWRRPGDVQTWERFAGQREMAAGLVLDHGGAAGKPGYPPTYLVEGLDAPWLFSRIYDATPRTPDGYASVVMLAQEDGVQFVAGLAEEDLGVRLADPRVRIFVGAGAGKRAAAFVNDRVDRGVRAVGPAITVPTTGARISPAPGEIVAAALERARNLNAELTERVKKLYEGKSREDWVRRFEEVRAGGPPLRVLVTTSRYSTFLRHSAADLCGGLEEIGCRTSLFMEPDEHSINDAAGDLRAIAEFEPDLVVVPNYLRSNLGGAYQVKVPLATWVQDSMPHLLNAKAGASMGELDFLLGNTTEDMFQKYGYPRGRSLAAPMAASTGKFHAGPVAEETRARHECEIAYVSHHSETPEAMLKRVGDVGNAPALVRALGAVFEGLRAEADRSIMDGPVTPRVRALVLEELGRAGVSTEEGMVSQVMSVVAMPLADRMIRHRTLEWAAEIARERGWRMHVYGRGWAGHPTLGLLARGELEHGEDLRACYRTARVHLHMSVHTAIHQRVFECALSGGLPVCRLMADDLSHLEYLAAAHASRAGDAAVCDAWRRAREYAFLGYRRGACAETERYARLLEQMGIAVPEFVWLNEIHAVRLRKSKDEVIDGDGSAVWDLWPDAGAVMFHDRASMERVLVRALENGDWRDGASRAMALRARERVTYGAFARGMLGLVERGLKNAPEAGGRWYDARMETGRGSAGL